METKLKTRLINAGKMVGNITAIVAVGILSTLIDESWRPTIGIGIALIGVTYLLLQIEYLKERVGVQNLSKHGFLDTAATTPIIPKHERSKPIPASGEGVKEGTLLFWKTFAGFATYFNKWLEDTPWRLQEQANSSIGGFHSDHYGRRYYIFYGPKLTGTLTVTDGEFSWENPETSLQYEIWGARTYSPNDIKTIAYWLAELLLFDKREEAAKKVESEMLSALWQLDCEAAHNPYFSFAMSGSAEFYVASVKARMKAA